jgi:hypothetical protein
MINVKYHFSLLIYEISDLVVIQFSFMSNNHFFLSITHGFYIDLDYNYIIFVFNAHIESKIRLKYVIGIRNCVGEVYENIYFEVQKNSSFVLSCFIFKSTRNMCVSTGILMASLLFTYFCFRTNFRTFSFDW